MTSLSRPRPRLAYATYHLLAAAALFLFIVSCGKSSNEVTDPQLKPIQEMLNAQLPVGSDEGTVHQFLSARGYPTQPTGKPGTLVALIRHIDTEKLEPVTALVTFYFDANGRLNTTEIERTFNRRPPMEASKPAITSDPLNATSPADTANPANASNP